MGGKRMGRQPLRAEGGAEARWGRFVGRQPLQLQGEAQPQLWRGALACLPQHDCLLQLKQTRQGFNLQCVSVCVCQKVRAHLLEEKRGRLGLAGGSRAAMVCPKRPSDDMCIHLQALFLNRHSRRYRHRRSHRRSAAAAAAMQSSVPVCWHSNQ